LNIAKEFLPLPSQQQKILLRNLFFKKKSAFSKATKVIFMIS
jgi:hypothetical protein